MSRDIIRANSQSLQSGSQGLENGGYTPTTPDGSQAPGEDSSGATDPVGDTYSTHEVSSPLTPHEQPHNNVKSGKSDSLLSMIRRTFRQ